MEADDDRKNPESWMTKSDGKRYRSWHLCVNNPTEEDRDMYVRLSEKKTTVYMIAADEVGEQGTHHFQGYVHFKDGRTQRAVLKDLKGRGYVKPAIASAENNTKYCEKQGQVFIRVGVLPKQGTRNDIKAVVEAVQRGDTMTEIIESVAENYQGVQIAKEYLKYAEPARTCKPEVYWYHGASGAGKSKDALEEANADADATIYMPLSNRGKFWEGYDGHDHVIINDFRKEWVPFSVLLQMLDHYEFRVENKGGSRQLRAKKIWITSPEPPEYYVPLGEDPYQLLRRLTVIREYVWPVDKEGEEAPRYMPERQTKMLGSSPTPSILYESDTDSEHILSVAYDPPEKCMQKDFKSVHFDKNSRRYIIEDARESICHSETPRTELEPEVSVVFIDPSSPEATLTF